MLGKLIKHEWIATTKLLLPLYIILCIVTILGKLLLVTIGNNDLFSPILGMLTVLYILYLFIIAIVTQIYLVIRFYKNIFTDEGYLTNTLPVTSTQLLNTKILVSFCWNFINFVLVALSIFVIVYDNKIITMIKVGIQSVYAEFISYFGFSPTLYVILFFILVILTLVYNILMFYCSIALGHKFGKHKVIGSFVAYIAIYAIMQVIYMIMTYIGSVLWDFNTLPTPSSIINAVNINLAIFSLISLIFGVAYYLITNIIVKKQLNLE